jgi:hypothetical protein
LRPTFVLLFREHSPSYRSIHPFSFFSPRRSIDLPKAATMKISVAFATAVAMGVSVLALPTRFPGDSLEARNQTPAFDVVQSSSGGAVDV